MTSRPPTVAGPVSFIKNLLMKIPLIETMRDYVYYLAMADQLSLEAWFLHWIKSRSSALDGITPNIVYFEFGVYQGDSLLKFVSAAKKYCRLFNEPLSRFYVYGFDSFRGLPRKQEGDDFMGWHQGQYEADLETVQKRIIKAGFPSSNFFLVPGFYEETLAADLQHGLLHDSVIPAIVMIDCDYYSSANTVLEWLRPLVLSGTVFYFDDIWSFDGHPQMGELRAINEFNQENNGQLTPRSAYGFRDHTFIYSAKEWELGEDSPYLKTKTAL